MTLTEPGTRVSLELYGRWPKGVPFKLEPGPKDVPSAVMVVLALKGEMQLKFGSDSWLMKAPPGPALLQWDNFGGADAAPQNLKELPDWADPTKVTDRAKLLKKYLEFFRLSVVAKGIEKTLDEALLSNDENIRRLAIYAMGAFDDMERLGQTLRTAQHPDVWDAGILALRHWLGRCPGQDQILYQGLIARGKMRPIHAETILTMLHSPGDEEIERPETYQLYIGLLDHEILGIRALAHWHLIRLVPEGKTIKYDPLSPKEDQVRAQKEWKKLIPSGELPKKPDAKPEKIDN
jgi:hypothetical protein